MQNESFRQRDKVMRAFKNDDKTERYIENFKTHYNFMRKHQALGMTPTQASGIEVKPEWRGLLEKSLK